MEALIEGLPDHYIEEITLGLAVVTLIVAGLGTWFAWRNHRARLQGQLPEIRMEPLDQGLYCPDQVMLIHFQVKTHHPSFGWRVTRVEVVRASPRACLRHAETGKGQWRDFDELDHPMEPGQYGELDARPGCNEVMLKFLCARPRKRWWKRRVIQEKKWIGPISTSWSLQRK